MAVSLDKISPCFSLSRYLSPQPTCSAQQATKIAATTQSHAIAAHPTRMQPKPAHHDTDPPQLQLDLHPTHLIALSLNEECRAWGHGRVFHLPLPSVASSRPSQGSGSQRGHPTDLVYTPSVWTEKMKKEWDMASWEDRLRGCVAGEFLPGPLTPLLFVLYSFYLQNKLPSINGTVEMRIPNTDGIWACRQETTQRARERGLILCQHPRIR
jgi:hypothetical protein